MLDFKDIVRPKVAALNLSPTREQEVIEELSQHLEEECEHAISRGASEEEAWRNVRTQFEEAELSQAEFRKPEPRPTPSYGQSTRTNFLGDLAQDVRFAFRLLIKNPAFTSIAVLALALGIGANTAIFSVVDSVLLRPLAFRNASQLVVVWEAAPHLGFPKNTPSPANFLDWRQQNTVFEGMAATAQQSFNLTGAGEPERLPGRRVSANLFDLLGVPAVVGRTFVADDDKPNTRVVLLSHSLWERRFGSDPGVVGRVMILSGQSYTVVGVMPRSVHLPGYGNWQDQVWVPMAFPAEEAAQREDHFLEVIARLKAGVTMGQAQAEMNTIAARLAQQYPKENTRVGATVTPLHEEVVGDIKPALLILLGAVGFVLLIACANVANLLLARAAVRQKEIALRLALGADRARLSKQFLTESLLLAAIGGAAGLMLSLAALKLLKLLIPADLTQAGTINIDARVLIFTALIAVGTGFVFGLAPATQAANFNLNETLKETGRDSAASSRGNRLRGMLVIGEVAVSFLLLIGAGLLINSFLHLRNLDPGFRAENLLTMKIDLSETKYPDRERRVAFFDEILRRVRPLPGVQSVAIAGNLPLTYYGDSMSIGIEGIADPPPDQQPDVIYRVIGPNYLRTMGIPLLRGRDFKDEDTADSKYAVIISQKTAEHFWPGQNPLGRRLKAGSITSDGPWREVIGVVKDVRQNGFIEPPKMQMYYTYRQLQNLSANALVIRTNVSPLSLASSVRSAIWSIDKDQPVADIDTMEHIVSEAVARQRFSMFLLGIFAALALVLAAVGIYGVMSYSVVQRTREIGIRMALGAQRSDVLKMTVIQGLRLVGAGLAIGLVAAFLLTRVMASLLFGISPTDPLTFCGISFVLLVVALLASYIPALRATRVDPMIALRSQ